MQRCVITILADDRVDDDPVTRQALLDNPRQQWGRYHSKFLTRPASPFLAFRDQHEVLRWLHIQLGTLLVANHQRCSQTPPPTVELPLAYVAWVLPTSFLWSSSHFNTDTTPQTGVFVKRLPYMPHPMLGFN